MSAEVIMARIFEQLSVAISLQMEALLTERLKGDTGRAERLRATATLFVAHALRLMAAHRATVEQWLGSQETPPQWVPALQ